VWIVAHNVQFEWAISTLCLGLPQPARWIDTMDLTLTRGLPGGADAAGEYLFGLPKDAYGYRLMMRLCKPSAPGRALPTITTSDIQALVNYVFRDTEIGERIGEEFGLLTEPEFEQQVRDLSLKINTLGIQFDRDFAETLDTTDDFFKSQARAEVDELGRKHGIDLKGLDLTRTEHLRKTINEALPPGLRIDNMRKNTLEDLLEDIDEWNAEQETRDAPCLVSPDLATLIRARLVVTRAALAKVETGFNQCGSDGRIRGQFKYHGAHTGRWSGNGTQPQNMKRPDEDFDLAAAISAVENKDRDAFIAACTDKKGKVRPAYELLGSLVRGIFIPRPGRVFVNCDFSAIESRVLLWLARDEEGLEDHRRADRGEIDDVYCAFASYVFGFPVTKKNKKERGCGKVGELACLAEGTMVATDTGWKPIEAITLRDRVWDGHQFVTHEGVVCNGVRDCINLNGEWMTPDHLVLVNESEFLPAASVQTTALFPAQSLAAGSLKRYSSALGAGALPQCAGAPAAGWSAWIRSISHQAKANSAEPAAQRSPFGNGGNRAATTPSCPTSGTVAASSTACTPPCTAATTPPALATGTTAPEASKCARNGATTMRRSCGTPKGFKAGTTPRWKSTGSTTSEATSPATSVSSPASSKCEMPGTPGGYGIKALSGKWATSATPSAPATRESPPSCGSSAKGSLPSKSSTSNPSAGAPTVRARVYDIKNCGPRHRFQTAGSIVHNCGFGGGSGAVSRFATALNFDLVEAGVDAQEIVNGWRGKHAPVVRLWAEYESAFRLVITGRSSQKYQTAGRCAFESRPYGRGQMVTVMLPSGRKLYYMNARIGAHPKDPKRRDCILYDTAVHGKVKTKVLYGGLLAENFTQAAASDLLRHAMLACGAHGYDIPLHIHDEVNLEVPIDRADEALGFIRRAMSTAPAWAEGIPLKAEPCLMRRFGK
jgi:DNA polymerase